ncbi:MAG: hypothetical protein ACP5KW_10700 [Thermoproteota archaeon]
MDEGKLVYKLAEYLNKKYESFFKKEEERYEVFMSKHGNKVEWSVNSRSIYELPGLSIIDDETEIWSHKFWETDELLLNMGYYLFGRVDDNAVYEIEKRENWKKYENSKIGFLVFLYKQIDEVVREIREKYEANLTFVPDVKPYYSLRFSTKDKDEEEIIRELERNLRIFDEAGMKISKLMGIFYPEFIFHESVQKELVENISKELDERMRKKYKHYIFPKDELVILKHKLKYLPIILLTSTLGLQKVGEEVPFPFTFGNLKYVWSNEDQRIFEELKNKVEVRIEKRIWRGKFLYLKEEHEHVFWPPDALELKEVKGEIRRVKEGILSSKDEKDVELLKNAVFIRDNELYLGNLEMEELVEKVNEDIKARINRLRRMISSIKREVGPRFWFSLVFSL